MSMWKWCLLPWILVSPVRSEIDSWDLAPVRYSDTRPTDALAALAADLKSGKREVEGQTELERLDFILKTLGVPVKSQVLVYSKTSHQNSLIRPSNPRALYFSMNAYVGYVPGGNIEVIIQDPMLGPVFYVIRHGQESGVEIERDLSTCISCHGTTATSNVPGMLVRSVIPDVDGHPLLAMGTSHVDHSSPLAERWGGYYVTGRVSLPHLGNRIYQNGGTADPEASNLADLSNVIDVTKYLQPTSDVVALMILEHQCRMHNLLTAASMNYRRAFYLGRAVSSTADPDQGAAGRVADGMADKIVECLFFKEEADPGEDTDGVEAFQNAFANEIPRTEEGRSLADFQLYKRLFKHRCSYMVYSEAFRELPPRVKQAVLERMRQVLSGGYPLVGWLNESECRRISAILQETLPGW